MRLCDCDRATAPLSGRLKNWGSGVSAKTKMGQRLSEAEAELLTADEERKRTLALMEGFSAAMADMLARKKEVEAQLMQSRRAVKRADTEHIHSTNLVCAP